MSVSNEAYLEFLELDLAKETESSLSTSSTAIATTAILPMSRFGRT